MPLSLGIASGAGFLKNKSEPAALGYRVNYIKNPSFEVDTSGWTSVASAVLSRTTGESHTGSASLSVTNTSGSAAQFGNTGTGNMIPLVAGEGTYYASAYIKLASGATTANYWLRHIQYESELGGATAAAGNIGITNLSYTGNWVRIGASFTKAANANFMVLRVVTASTVSGEVFYVDSVLLEKSSTLKSYFDGESNGFWAGTANNSFSGGTPY